MFIQFLHIKKQQIGGHPEVCELPNFNTKEENPASNNGRTIRHEMAVILSNKCIYKFQIISIKDKLPKCDTGDKYPTSFGN